MINKIDAWLKGYFFRIFSLDLRSLAVFRMGVAAMLLIDLAVRAGDFSAQMSDAGVLPRALAWGLLDTQWRFSAYFLSGAPGWSFFLLGLSAVSACCLLIGYQTRLVSILSWLLLASLHARNQLLIDSGDHLLRYLLFWGMFLPLGARLSVDCFLKAKKNLAALPDKVCSMGSAALMLQVAMAYWFAAYLKRLTPEWNSGQAIEIALGAVGYVSLLGDRAAALPPRFLQTLTDAVLAFEAWGVFLFFMPVCFQSFRKLGVILFVLMHVLFAAFLDLGIFPWVDIAAILIFIPESFWKEKKLLLIRFQKFFSAPAQERIVDAEMFPKTVLTSSLIMNALAGFFLALVFLWNVSTSSLTFKMPEILKRVGYLAAVDQRWGMYAPPASYRSWMVMPARLMDGTEKDLVNWKRPKPLDWNRPSEAVSFYPNTRWRNYILNLGKDDKVQARDAFLDFVTREWNSRRNEREKIAKLGMFHLYQYFFPQLEEVSIVRLK